MKRFLLGLSGVLSALLIWQVLVQLSGASAKYVPPPTAVLPELVSLAMGSPFWVSIAVTLEAWAKGLAIAMILGTVLGLTVGLSPVLRKVTRSTTEFLRPIPSVALIPLAVLMFGVKVESAVFLIAYAAFWQVFIQVLYGVADVDKVAISTGLSYGFSNSQRLRHIVIPTMLPYLLTGVRLAAAVSLILAITAQLIIGNPGIGLDIVRAQNAANYELMYALLVAAGLLGVIINVIVRLVERRVLKWHESVRGETREA